MTALDLVEQDESLRRRKRMINDIITELSAEPGLADHIIMLRAMLEEIEEKCVQITGILARTEVAPQ